MHRRAQAGLGCVVAHILAEKTTVCRLEDDVCRDVRMRGGPGGVWFAHTRPGKRRSAAHAEVVETRVEVESSSTHSV